MTSRPPMVGRRRSGQARRAGARRRIGHEKDRQSDLSQQALADSGVQAMLDVFADEIKEVEEM